MPTGVYPRPSLRERFDAKVVRGESCWEWAGGRSAAGYGVIRDGSRLLFAHRLAYELVNGEIPEGTEIDHLCRNRACVNPEHLEAVSHRENILRGETLQAENASKTHCLNGHEFTPENTYINPKGWRDCRICKRERWRAWRARQ